MTVEERAWLAGLFEGEGCVSLRWREPRGAGIRPDAALIIHSTDQDIMDRVGKLVGRPPRYVGVNKRAYQKKPSWLVRITARDDVIGLILQLRGFMGSRRKAKMDEVLRAFADYPRRRRFGHTGGAVR